MSLSRPTPVDNWWDRPQSTWTRAQIAEANRLNGDDGFDDFDDSHPDTVFGAKPGMR